MYSDDAKIIFLVVGGNIRFGVFQIQQIGPYKTYVSCVYVRV